MTKDYYQILGVGRDADDATLKKAYHTLAQEFHPDKNPDNPEPAEEKFKEISEAYSVLSNPDKKRAYDMTGSPNGLPGGFRTTGDLFDLFRGGPFGAGQHPPQRNPPMRGQSLRIPLEVTLAESLFGTKMPLNYDVISACHGCGGRRGQEFEICEPCGGRGFVQLQQGNMFIQRPCDKCGGAGESIKVICSDCRGNGVIPEHRRLNIVIPVGIRNGSALRLSGQGGAGLNEGPPGDVMVEVSVSYPDIENLTEDERTELKRLLDR